mmetsp:Transcript_27205/g.54994  ORF Transcript_27205/g.54994 Transcript_27205/m.54994 type:complete len:257 (-) Transcript_27205:67-837(-)
MGGSDSSSESSSSARRKAKKADKKSKKKEKKEGKKPKHPTKKGSKRKLSASSGSSSASAAKKKKKGKKEKKEKKQKVDSKDEAQQRWIFGREKAIRKAEPNVSKEEALRRAVDEYCALYNDGKPERPEDAAPEPASAKRITSADDIENDHVRETVEQAVREAREDAKAAGKTEEEAEEEAAKAREAVLFVAERTGLYQPPAVPEKQMSLFLQEKDKELDEYVRKGMPLTDDRPRTAEYQPPAKTVDLTRIRVLSGT